MIATKASNQSLLPQANITLIAKIYRAVVLIQTKIYPLRILKKHSKIRKTLVQKSSKTPIYIK